MATGRRALEEEMSRFEQEIGQEGKANSYPQRYGFPPQNPNFPQYPAYQMVPPHNVVNNPGVAIPPSIPPAIPPSIPPAIPPVLPPQSSIRQPSNLNTVTPEQQRQWESQYQVGASKSTTSVTPSSSGSTISSKQETLPKDKKGVKGKDKKILRMAGGQVWEDNTLTDWDPNDFRLFCGDLGNEVTEELLTRIFSKYSSLQNVKVVRDKRSNKTKGYGFLSFKDSKDYLRAMKEMNGKYVGNRPIKLRKSSWKDRNIEMVKKKEREKKRLGFR